MCTASWNTSSEGDVLWFNRDEQRSRGTARPPSETISPEGILFLAPTDPDAGGTWIGGNETGLMVCLLNAYDRGFSPTPPTISRGLLVTHLLGAAHRQEAVDRTERFLEKEDIAPCRILLWEPNQAPLVLEVYAGSCTRVVPDVPMLTTSMYRSQEVEHWRLHAFQAASSQNHWQESLHGMSHPDDPAFGVWMHREDACTVSQTRIIRTSTTLQLGYRTHPDEPWSEIAIPRRPE